MECDEDKHQETNPKKPNKFQKHKSRDSSFDNLKHLGVSFVWFLEAGTWYLFHRASRDGAGGCRITMLILSTMQLSSLLFERIVLAKI